MRVIDRHIAIQVIAYTLLVLLVLTALASIVTFVGEFGSIGKGSYKDWQHITSWTNILYAVNDQGVIRKMLPAIAAVEEACRSIYQRATGGDARTDERPARWETPTLRAEELDGIRLAMLVFRVLSVREYEEAYALALARVKTERGVVEVAEVPAPADDHFRGVGKKVC